jgi:hypothetical protein
VLAAVVKQAERSQGVESPGILFVEVAFDNFLERAKAIGHLELYRNGAPLVRDRLVIMLSGISTGTPVARIHDVTGRLSPFVSGIGFCLDKLEAPEFDVGQFNDPYLAFAAIGLDQGVPDVRISQLAAQLHARRGRCLIRHVPSIERVGRLRSLGVDAVSLAQTLPPSRRKPLIRL